MDFNSVPKINKDLFLASLAIAFVILSALIASGISIKVQDILLYGKFADKFSSIVKGFILLFASFYIVSKVRNKRTKYAVYLVSSAIFVLLVRDFIVLISFICPILFSALITAEDKISGLWKSVSAPKTYASAVIFILLVLYFGADKEKYAAETEEVISKILAEYAKTGAEQIKESIKQSFPDGISEEERKYILNELSKNIPHFNELDDSTKNKILSQTIQQYIGVKKSIKESIARRMDEVKLIEREEIKKTLEKTGFFRKLMDHVDIILSISYVVIFSLLSWIATVISFIILIPFHTFTRIYQQKKAQKTSQQKT